MAEFRCEECGLTMQTDDHPPSCPRCGYLNMVDMDEESWSENEFYKQEDLNYDEY
jgi:Zn finger protein HypA/HybF involved in hydrogenase expression